MHLHALAAAAARHPARPAVALRALGAQERDLAVLVPLVRRIREIRAARAASRPRNILRTKLYSRALEPGDLRWALRAYRDEKARARREQVAQAAAKRLRWRSDRAAEAVRAYAMLGDHHEAVLATLEAITREARAARRKADRLVGIGRAHMRASADARGASSATHTHALMAGYHERRARALYALSAALLR